MSEARRDLLLVEDDTDLRNVMALMLSELGYEVRSAREGGEALALVAQRMPHLILLDMRMPGMNGWEFARLFRERYGRAAPIVVVTAATDARARAADIGADAFLGKPFETEEMLALVRRFAEQKQA